MIRYVRTSFLALLIAAAPAAADDWFESLKASGDREALYRVLYHMPKGGDLHQHLSGSNFPDWWYEIALAQEDNGYVYYTKVRINNCVENASAFGRNPYLLLFRNITEREYNRLDECQQDEYKLLENLTDDERADWGASIQLTSPGEGRDEFFQTHWQRLNSLANNPYVQAEMMVRNMQAFGAEGLSYLEMGISIWGLQDPEGNVLGPQAVADILRDRLDDADAKATGVTVRFQVPILRFTPVAEDHLRIAHTLVFRNQDLFVAVDLVGREDNDKGHPRRFLETLRDLRRKQYGVRLAIHAGEVDEPNYHVRDTLLLGAERIGHGLNLITDDETMLLMRGGDYLVEINLISNLLLEYVSDYSQHPFPEYLRTGIPVALSTDDRGMWDSNMTDEFFVAVSEFNLSWNEVKLLSRNSLEYSFLDAPTKQALLADFDDRMRRFEANIERYELTRIGDLPATQSFVCKRYEVCGPAE